MAVGAIAGVAGTLYWVALRHRRLQVPLGWTANVAFTAFLVPDTVSVALEGDDVPAAVLGAFITLAFFVLPQALAVLARSAAR